MAMFKLDNGPYGTPSPLSPARGFFEGETMNSNSHSEELLASKDKVATSLRELMAGTEELLRSTASYTGEEIEHARRRLRTQLDSARNMAGTWESTAAERYRQAADVTDEYVHENAWKSIGVAAVIGLLLGACLASGRDRQ